MSRLIAISIFVSIFITIGCGSEKTFFPDDPDISYIAIGNGGGFTGKITVYYLLNNGEVYKGSEFTNEFTLIGKIDKSMVKQQWKNYEELHLSSVQINDPGNYYYFMEFKSGNQQNKMVWQELGPEHGLILTTYNNLNNTINNISNTYKSQK